MISQTENLQGIMSTLEKIAEKLGDIYYNTRFIAFTLKEIADAQTMRGKRFQSSNGR